MQRPHGFRMIPLGEEENFLTPLPVEKLHGIGHVHTGALAERGIATIGQLRQVPKPALRPPSAKPSASKSGSVPAASMAARCCCLQRRNPFPAKPPSKAGPSTRNFSAA